MRICFVSHSGAAGGAERSLLETIDVLRGRGCHCRAVVPFRGFLTQELRRRSVPCHVIPHTWWMGHATPPWKRHVKQFVNMIMVWFLAGRLKRWACDIVYSNSITAPVGAFAARRRGLTHVWHIHEFGYEHHGLTYDLGEEHSMRTITELSDVCIAASGALKRYYQEHIPADRIRVVYQPVRPPAVQSTQTGRGTFQCILVGTLHEAKGHEEAIMAIARLVATGHRVELSIVGDGDDVYRRRLTTLVAEQGVAEQVTFHGFVGDPYPLIQSSSVLLVCSRSEGFGRTAVEAMHCGKPVIGANSGGTAELVTHGFNGLLYTPGDDADLADRITTLLRDPTEATRLGENGRRWAAQTFDLDHYADEMVSLLNAAVPGRHDSRRGQPVAVQVDR